MARRRLSPPPEGLEIKAGPRITTLTDRAAPISAQAASASREAALEEMSQALSAARAEGRMVVDLDLDAVDPGHLARDRIVLDDADLAALMASIAQHGQRTPIEVTAPDRTKGETRYGLISGWRRLSALKALAQDHPRDFGTVRAFLRQPRDAGAAYVAMVEENEIRVGLSYYERARIAAIATDRGVFGSEKAALLALFATASRPKRSRIRAFLAVYRALDGQLAYPAALGERLGLKLAEALEGPERDAIVTGIASARPESAEAEQALIADLIKPLPPQHLPKAGPYDLWLGETRITQKRQAGKLTVTFEGPSVSDAFQATLRDLLQSWGAKP